MVRSQGKNVDQSNNFGHGTIKLLQSNCKPS